MSELEEIKKSNEARRLNIMKGFSEVIEIQKAVPNFGSDDDEDDEEYDDEGFDDFDGDDDDFEGQDDEFSNDDQFQNENQKTVSDFAKETKTEDLEAYLKDNPNGPHAEDARNELENREGSEGEGSEETIDYSNPESVKQALQNHPDKQEIFDMLMEDPTLTASMALRLHDSQGGDKVGLNDKINAAQQALDDLKSHVGSDDDDESNDDWFDDDYEDDGNNEEEEEEEYDEDFDDEDEQEEDDENEEESDLDKKKKRF